MILSEKGKNIVELISFDHFIDDNEVKKKYLLWLEDLNVTNSISSLDLILPKDQSFVDDSFRRFSQKTTIGFFIKHISDNVVIGTIKLDCISFYKRNAMDGIMIGDTSYHGRGIAQNAYRILLGYAFNVLGMERIYGGCNEKNKAMIKIYEKLGYKKEGVLRANDYINGKYSDHFLFGILRKEFLKVNKVILS